MSQDADLLSGAVPHEGSGVTGRGHDRRQAEDISVRARRDAALEDRLARALGEANRLRAELADARRAAAEAAARADRAAREIIALRIQAQMALAANLRWPPRQPGAARPARSARLYHRPMLPEFPDRRGAPD